MYKATIPLRESCDNYIAYKRASGIKAEKEEQVLHRFVSLVEHWEPGATTISKESAIKWENLSPNEAPTNQEHRKDAVNRLSKYLIEHNIPAYVYPSYHYAKSQFVPYIFSNDELARFFTACDNTKTPHLLRSDIVSLIFRMIYSCGLRVSEATNLTVRDVDLLQGVLHIRDAKFDKERLLPVHDDLLKRMKEYNRKVHSFSGMDKPFFPNPQGNKYFTGGIYSMFRERLWAAKISHGGKGNGPRVHDLRHTFAVHCLRRAVYNGEDLNSTLKYLSVYMGHESIIATQTYLRLTADLYPDIVCKMEKDFDVLPDWEGFDEDF